MRCVFTFVTYLGSAELALATHVFSAWLNGVSQLGLSFIIFFSNLVFCSRECTFSISISIFRFVIFYPDMKKENHPLLLTSFCIRKSSTDEWGKRKQKLRRGDFLYKISLHHIFVLVNFARILHFYSTNKRENEIYKFEKNTHLKCLNYIMFSLVIHGRCHVVMSFWTANAEFEVKMFTFVQKYYPPN